MARARGRHYTGDMAGSSGPETIDNVAKMLAGEHVADDPAIQSIYLVPHSSEVRLIEITSSVQPDGEILPFRFPAASDVPFKSLVVMVNPKDWARRGQLRWPVELDPNSQRVEQIFERQPLSA